MSKNSKLMKFLILPLLFGLVSLVLSFIIAHLVTKLVFIIPHYSTTKEGTFSVLLSMFIGLPLGVVLYFVLSFVKSIKKRFLFLFMSIFIIFSSLALFDIVDGSCISMKNYEKWNDEINKTETRYMIWSKICE